MQAKSPITRSDVDSALDTEIVIAEQAAVSGSTSRRKLVYNVSRCDFTLWIGEHCAWEGGRVEEAVCEFNEFDAGKIDYTPENLAYAGV